MLQIFWYAVNTLELTILSTFRGKIGCHVTNEEVDSFAAMVDAVLSILLPTIISFDMQNMLVLDSTASLSMHVLKAFM